MTYTIQRGRQFAAGDVDVMLFDERGRLGSFLPRAAQKLVAQRISVVVKKGPTAQALTAVSSWNEFLAAHCGTKAQAAKLEEVTGITFSDFVETIDDLAASDATDLVLDLRPSSSLAKALGLDLGRGDYAAGLPRGTTVGPAQAAGAPAIGKDLVAAPIRTDWERDRTELESWADFAWGDGASRAFRDHTGPAPYAKLYRPRWSDAEAMSAVSAFTLPLFPEVTSVDPDGSPKFQDGSEMFRDTYFEDRRGALAKAGVSLRVRVRFDNTPPHEVNRVLLQAKESRAISGSASAVRKLERRWERSAITEAAAKALLVSGRERPDTPLVLAQKVYTLLRDRGALADDGLLQLEEKYVVLQKRRRTHLHLLSVDELRARRAELETEAQKARGSGAPVPAALGAYAAKLDAQLTFLSDAKALLSKYGQWLPSGECFIVSADRYAVYDAVARATTPPADLDDGAGRLGRGPLHIEAEWDSGASDPFEKAGLEIDRRLSALPAAVSRNALQLDRAVLEGMRATFRNDVAQAVQVVRAKLLAEGLGEVLTKKSKDEHASDFAKAEERPQWWL